MFEERDCPAERDCPDWCFQGSTVFYATPETDEYTPSYLEAGLLECNMTVRGDGTHPPWFDPASADSPMKQYVAWFNGIWHTGDPSQWGPSVFTNTAVIVDPTGAWRGAESCAAYFQVLFKYFPELRGEVISWAANDREIMINWRFLVPQRGSDTALHVPVTDKFCFRAGCVSHRLAFFDILTFMGYMTNYYGQAQLTDYLLELLGRAEATGGVESVPRLLARVIRGLFVWPTRTPTLSLSATPRDGFVALEWEADPEAASYALTRATDLAGPFETPPGPEDASQLTTNSYVDTEVENGVTYWYLVSPNRFRPVPIVPGGLVPLGRPGAAVMQYLGRRPGGGRVEAVGAGAAPSQRPAAAADYRPKPPSNN